MAVRDYPRQSPPGRRLEGTSGKLLTFAVIPLLLIAALLLPPISLIERVSGAGASRVTEAGGTVSDPDGSQIVFPPGAVQEPFGVKLSSVPRETFLSGQAGKDLVDAAKAIPNDTLQAKSPFYRLTVRGETPSASTWVLPIPNDSEPYETLDVYTWEGETQRWQWLPHKIINEDDQIESNSPAVPLSIMVVQTSPKPALASADLALASDLSDDGKAVLAEAHPKGYYLAAGGGLEGAVDATFDQLAGAFAVVPVVRNYEGPIVRTDLFANMLVDGTQRAAHVDALVNLAVGNLYKGIDLDYRGLDRNLRGEYLQFLKDLADKLHAQGKELGVRVEAPAQVSDDAWDTGAYDWQAIGLIADTVKIGAPVDPRAYATNGQYDALLRYAVGQVDRFKIRIVFSGQSVELAGAYFLPKSYSDALQPLIGRVAADQTVVEPGQPLNLALVSSRPNSGLVFDPNIGTYVYLYQDDQGNARTVWLENAASLNHKLEILKQYNVQGLTLENLPGDGADADLWPLIRNYQQGALQPMQSEFVVEWTVKGADGQMISQVRPLSDSALVVAAPNEPGAIAVEAAIKDRHQVLARTNADSIAVATYTPTATPTPEFTPTPTATATPDFAQATANSNANTRSGPSTAYGRVGQLKAGQSYRITGQSTDGLWWQLLVDGKTAWVTAELVTVSGNAEGVAVVEVAPPPTAAPVAVAAAPAASAPAAPRPAGGGSFAYGMQVDPNGGHMNAIPPLGIRWVKFQVPWVHFEGSPGAKNFPDGWVNEAKANGLSILASIVKAPAWARNQGFLRGEGPPQNPADFASYAGAFAGHYCGQVQAIEVWNEQNMDYEWGYEPLDPVRYMELLKAAYAAIKAACPGMIVVSGAPTPAGMVLPQAYDDREYLKAMYRNGLARYSDAIGVHPSGFGNPPDVTVQDFQAGRYSAPSHVGHPSFYMLNTLQDYRNIMVANGDANKRLWPTEFGWGSTSSPHPGYEYEARISESMQADYIVRGFQKMKSMGYVGVAFLWCLDYNVTQPSTELAAFGILGRPAYDAIRNMPK